MDDMATKFFIAFCIIISMIAHNATANNLDDARAQVQQLQESCEGVSK